jgi:hypothetical protein
MREKWRRKLDWLYEGTRRRALKQLYRGDPSDPANHARISSEEILPRTEREQT